ncbi:MAG: hypothetical protein NW226_24595 [Microscillaceae bacterium]|nr:hypothetical protein [Microscillaceae bacterium]
MRKQVYASDFVKFEFDEDTSIFYEDWSSNLSKEEVYKQEVMNKKDLVLRHHPKNILDDISHCDFSIHPELQNWTEEILGPAFMEIGLERYAILLPSDLFTQVSMEQTADEFIERNEGMQVNYFESFQEAENWLKAN